MTAPEVPVSDQPPLEALRALLSALPPEDVVSAVSEARVAGRRVTFSGKSFRRPLSGWPHVGEVRQGFNGRIVCEDPAYETSRAPGETPQQSLLRAGAEVDALLAAAGWNLCAALPVPANPCPACGVERPHPPGKPCADCARSRHAWQGGDECLRCGTPKRTLADGITEYLIAGSWERRAGRCPGKRTV